MTNEKEWENVCEYRFPTANYKLIKEIITENKRQIGRIHDLLDLLKEHQIIYNANYIGHEIFIYPTADSSPIVFNLGNTNEQVSKGIKKKEKKQIK